MSFAGETKIVSPGGLIPFISVEIMNPSYDIWQICNNVLSSPARFFDPDEPEQKIISSAYDVINVTPRTFKIKLRCNFDLADKYIRDNEYDISHEYLTKLAVDQMNITVSKLKPELYTREFSLESMEKLITGLYEKEVIRGDSICVDIKLSKYQQFFLVSSIDNFRLFMSKQTAGHLGDSFLILKAYLHIINENSLLLGRYDINKMDEDAKYNTRVRY